MLRFHWISVWKPMIPHLSRGGSSVPLILLMGVRTGRWDVPDPPRGGSEPAAGMCLSLPTGVGRPLTTYACARGLCCARWYGHVCAQRTHCCVLSLPIARLRAARRVRETMRNCCVRVVAFVILAQPGPTFTRTFTGPGALVPQGSPLGAQQGAAPQVRLAMRASGQPASWQPELHTFVSKTEWWRFG